jgi:hypothetical protein
LTGIFCRAIGRIGLLPTVYPKWEEKGMRHVSIKDSWEVLLGELKDQWHREPERQIIEYTIKVKLHEGLIEQQRNMGATQSSLLEQQRINNKSTQKLVKYQNTLADHQKKVAWTTGILALFTFLLVVATGAYAYFTWATLGNSEERITAIKDLVTASARQASVLDLQAAALGRQVGTLNALRASMDPLNTSLQDLSLSAKMLPVEADRIRGLQNAKNKATKQGVLEKYEQKKKEIRDLHFGMTGQIKPEDRQ